MANITQTLNSLIDLSAKNLNILKTINEAFYSKHDHISTTLDETGTTYTIPSFIHLENRINHLQEAFTNLVNSPASGEAFFNFDGNSKAIEIRSYQLSPNPINIIQDNLDFSTKPVDIFKDFLTPVPYYRLNLYQLPDDISQVMVKKVVIYEEVLLNQIKNATITDPNTNKKTNKISYPVLKSILEISGNPNNKFSEIDTLMNLPIRQKTAGGMFSIKQVNDDFVNDNLEHIAIFEINESPTYTIFDGYSISNLVKGDQLTTFDGTAKMTITEIDNQRIKVRVNSAEYLNLKVGDKLRFFKANDFTTDRYIDIPLEEDQNILVFVSPVNSRMRIQSEVGTGILLDTYKLTLQGDSKVNFEKYYKENVRNIGDILFELTNLYGTPISQFSKLELNTYLTLKPSLIIDSENTYQVSQINKHKNSGIGELKIKELYGNKKQKELERQSILEKISKLELDKFNLSNSNQGSELLTDLNTQISSLREQSNSLELTINSILQQIQQVGSDSNIGIGLNKYHIRGYVDILNNVVKRVGLDEKKVIGIEVLYRYKHPTSPTNNTLSLSIENTNYLCTEWNLYIPPLRNQNISYENGKYNISKEPYISDLNNIKFNQIEIPITQGESVDFMVRFVYEFGYPFIRTYSDWSDVTSVDFPDELKSSPHIENILNETNEELKKLELLSLIESKGVLNHFSDEFKDYDTTFHHKADNISSGFFTEDRKVISLYQKLQDLSNTIATINGTLSDGSNSDAGLSVSFSLNNSEIPLNDTGINVIGLPSRANATSTGNILIIDMENSQGKNRKMWFARGYIVLKNNSSTQPVRLYNVLPFAPKGKLYNEFHNKNNNPGNSILLNSIFTPWQSLDQPDKDDPNIIHKYGGTSLFNAFLKVGSKEDYSFQPQVGGQVLYFNERAPHSCIGENIDFTTWYNGSYKGSMIGGMWTHNQILETARLHIEFFRDSWNALMWLQRRWGDNISQVVNKRSNTPLYYDNDVNNKGKMTNKDAYMFVQPLLVGENELIINQGDYKTLNPGDSIKIPLLIGISSNAPGLESESFIPNYIYRQGFMIRTSAYKEPRYFELEYRSPYNDVLLSQGTGSKLSSGIKNYNPNLRND